MLVHFLWLDEEPDRSHDMNSFEDDEDYDERNEDGSGSGDGSIHETSDHEEGSGYNVPNIHHEMDSDSR